MVVTSQNMEKFKNAGHCINPAESTWLVERLLSRPNLFLKTH